MSDEKLEAAGAEAMREGGETRGRASDLTPDALRDHGFDPAGTAAACALIDRMAEVAGGFLDGISEAARPRDRKP
jgi:hypothetical protein